MGKSLVAPKPATRSKKSSLPAEVREYKGRVEELFETVSQWANAWSPKAAVRRIKTTVNEAVPGDYDMEILELQLPEMRPVRLRPAGCYIIGAQGRVEIESNLGRETLVYLSKAGPAMTIQIRDESGKLIEKPSARRIGKETAQGWVWVQHRLLKLYPTLNDDLMRRMVEALGR